MVSAWACQNGVILGQQKTDAKSNEITAIPQDMLHKLLGFDGSLTHYYFNA